MYLEIIIRCIFFYFVLIAALRVMGKREVGELSVFDIVIYLVMSELLALGVTEPGESLLKSLLPIATLALLQIVLSFILLKFQKLRIVMEGSPVILIHNGVLNQREMKKQRYSLDDLLSQLREKDCCCLNEVEFAVLENNGNLSVILKKDCTIRHPNPVIQDGIIDMHVLKDIGKDEQWLQMQLYENGYENASQIFICMIMKKGLYILEKN